jgi:hypothetical protein
MIVSNAVVAKAHRWATRFIKEQIDTEGKFVASAAYELKGSDLHKALVHAFMVGLDNAAAKFSPISAGRGASPGDGPGRTGAQSSRRDGKKSTPPGDKLAGSPARVMRRLQQRGEKFYDDLDKL